ncbi:MAG: HAD family hydrolase [bacterium]
MIILLFDIDGTLILTGGAGMRGMNRAFVELFNVENALDGLTLSGMTDKIIFRDACKKANIEFSERNHANFKQSYIEYLKKEIEKPAHGKQILPGVQDLLEKLRFESEIRLGLLTGNYAPCAKIKLQHFGLDQYFEFGAYGDDNEDRNKLVPYALTRYSDRIGQNGKITSTWIIGDTPKDVRCARPHHAKAIAVATGGYSEEELAKAEPDATFTDLTDSRQFLDIIKKVS